MPLIDQTASQRTWPEVGDIDDCWILAWQMCQIAVASWLRWLDTTTARAFAGDPDDGNKDGNDAGVHDMMRGLRAATPALAALCTPISGTWSFEKLLPEIKSGRPFAAAVMAGLLPRVYTTVAHQVVLFHVEGIGLHCADPMAPDRSKPYHIPTARAKIALEAFAGKGKVSGVLFPTEEQAFKTHPLYVAASSGKFTEAQVKAQVGAAKAASDKAYQGRIHAIRAKVAEHADATVALSTDIAND